MGIRWSEIRWKGVVPYYPSGSEASSHLLQTVECQILRLEAVSMVSSAYPAFPRCEKFWGTRGWRCGGRRLFLTYPEYPDQILHPRSHPFFYRLRRTLHPRSHPIFYRWYSVKFFIQMLQIWYLALTSASPRCAKFWGTGGWRSGEGGHRTLSKCILRLKCINSCSSYLRRFKFIAGSRVCQFKDPPSSSRPISSIRQNLNSLHPGHDTLFSLTTPPGVGLWLTIARIFHVRS